MIGLGTFTLKKEAERSEPRKTGSTAMSLKSLFYQGRQIKDEHGGKRQQNHNNHLRAALAIAFLAAVFDVMDSQRQGGAGFHKP